MKELVNLTETYGLSVLIISLSIIAILGILKLCKVFDKIKNKDIKKFVYFGIDIVLAFGCSAIYFAIFKKDWSGYFTYSIGQFAAVVILYAFYEHWGIRKIVRLLIGAIAKWIKKNPEAQLSKWANKIGLQDAIEKINVEIETAKKKEAEELAKAEAAKVAATIAESTAPLKTETIEIKEKTE